MLKLNVMIQKNNVIIIIMLFLLTNCKWTLAQENNIYTVVDEMPSFVGGQIALSNYISVNLRYPDEAKKNQKEGIVYASFIVEKDGSITNVSIVKGIGYGCDEEVVRVLSAMPKWLPGKQKGNPVRVKLNLPVNFSLKN